MSSRVLLLLVSTFVLLSVLVSAAPSTSSPVAARLTSRLERPASAGDSADAPIDTSAAEAAMSQYIIDVVNASPNGGWTAGVNEYFQDKSYAFLKKSCGLKMTPAQLAVLSAPTNLIPIPDNSAPFNPYNPYNPYTPSSDIIIPNNGPVPLTPVTPPTTPDVNNVLPTPTRPVSQALPLEFDARRQWGATCPSLYDIRDQAGCGSCWAVAAAEVMTDRTCIASNGASRPYLSAKNILTCCGAQCGGCEGGYPIHAFQMWQNEGVVTGGSFGTSDTCQPYFLASCEHHTTGPLPQCVPHETTPSCSRSCTHGKEYHQDKYFGVSAYQVTNTVEAIQRELLTNGPIEVGFMVYADFPHYKSGVYSHTTGEMVGGHAVKLMGWGTENGRAYWLCANSWNTNWGSDGYFKIARGVNEGGIEDMAWAGMARV